VGSQTKPAIDLAEGVDQQYSKLEVLRARKTNLFDRSHNASQATLPADPLLNADDVAARLNVTKDWVWDHSSRKAPYLPVIRMGDGTLRYRASKIEEFIDERERLSNLRRKSG
jgi:predicted DNA-binding transcriptional regulator AlpA